ncbi:MAG: hypothetical protein GY834_02910 [Bacteroidetes bacterium]|nr:hypothetical protein [Bacteroidota bacterium]
MTKRTKYSTLCQTELGIPLFSQDCWLNAVCGEDNWDVAIVETGEKITASMPYMQKKRSGFTVSRMPPLTQTLGPWIKPSQAKYAKQLGQQKN